MKIFYSENHRKHNPPFEVFDGGQRVPYLENPDRMDQILSALKNAEWAEITAPQEFGDEPILAVHDAAYLQFLRSAWQEWLQSNPDTESASDKTALLPATFAIRRPARAPQSLLGRAGYYLMDLSAVIVDGTYQAAVASAHCALSAAEEALRSSTAFALCRPPGHHAGRNFAAGYCFINNAAVAANYLSKQSRVALLDIDYHAGNGTQDIFYERADVLTISIHRDPNDEYPYYAGFAEETGAGDGLGFHCNFPLPAGTDDAEYLSTLAKALKKIGAFAPDYLVLSVGMDIYQGDPLGKFHVTRAGIKRIGEEIASLHYPTAIIMEGGYANQALGQNMNIFLGEFVK